MNDTIPTKLENKNQCHMCTISLTDDESGSLMGINENELFFCYKCYFHAQDEEQVKKDDEDMIKKGYVEMPDGRWRKKKEARRSK